MLYGQSSAEGRAIRGAAEFRDPAEDRAWAQAFLNDFEAADDEDGQRQVLSDYGHELTDPVRQDALRENFVGRLHRKAELEKMDAREYMDRLSALDSAPFGSKAGGQRRPGEYGVANAALLQGLMGSAGIAGAPLRAPVPGRLPGSLGRMTPPPVFGPYPGFPADKQVKPDPFILPVPDRREPPVLPGGSRGRQPVDEDNRTVLPDQSGEWNKDTLVYYETREGFRFRPRSPLSHDDHQRVSRFIKTSPSKATSRVLAEMADQQLIALDKGSDDFLVNINKEGGERPVEAGLRQDPSDLWRLPSGYRRQGACSGRRMARLFSAVPSARMAERRLNCRSGHPIPAVTPARTSDRRSRSGTE